MRQIQYLIGQWPESAGVVDRSGGTPLDFAGTTDDVNLFTMTWVSALMSTRDHQNEKACKKTSRAYYRMRMNSLV
jgi:hypothetical protein